MRALVVDGVRVRPEVREVADPEPPAGGVVVRVAATGLCRSDWHGWVGHDDGITFPHVPGHELAGTVEAVGEGVIGWGVGDRVTVPFACGCGRCTWCRQGDAQVCPDQRQPGFTDWGSFAELVALHAADANLVAVPDSVGFVAAAALGCRLATAYRAVVARAGLVAGEWVTVVGAGGVGLSAVQVATALGGRVVAVDPSADARAMALDCGAEVALAPGDGDVAAAVAELTGGGSHVSVDAVGSEVACATAITSLRRRGRHVQVGLLPPVEGRPRVPMDRVIAWELDVLGSHGMAAADYPVLLSLVDDGSLHPEALVGAVVGLDAAADLLVDGDRPARPGLTVIEPWR